MQDSRSAGAGLGTPALRHLQACKKFSLAEASASDAAECDVKYYVGCSKWPDMKWLIKKSSRSKQSQRTLELILKVRGLVRDLNPGPLAPEARIIPLDQRA